MNIGRKTAAKRFRNSARETVGFMIRIMSSEKGGSMKVRNLLFVLFALVAPAHAEPVVIGAGDSVQSILAGKKNERVTVRTRGGAELTGQVRDVNARIVVLGAVQGREFFDAVVPLDAVEAVLIRTK